MNAGRGHNEAPFSACVYPVPKCVRSCLYAYAFWRTIKEVPAARAGHSCQRFGQVIVLHLQIVQRVFPVFARPDVYIDHKYVSAYLAGDNAEIVVAHPAIEPKFQCAFVRQLCLKCFPAGSRRVFAG